MSRASLSLLDDFRVVASINDNTYDVCAIRHGADTGGAAHARECLVAASMSWRELTRQLEAATPQPTLGGRRLPPVYRPVNVFGAPVNYRSHEGELRRDRSPSRGTTRELGLFVKPTGSVSGPDDTIELPDLAGRECHYEGEIAVVIGREADGVAATDALAYVAGYTGALDVTLRLEADHREERSMRKSYKTFTPLGPELLPAACVTSPENLGLRLRVNGEERQRGRLDQLIVNVAELVALASSIVPLQPGDVILTGTPAGVGPLHPGDVVEVEVDGIEPMTLKVALRGTPRCG